MTTIIDGMLALRRVILLIADALSWVGPTLARLTVGWIMLLSGWGKLHNLEQVINYFGELGIPHPELQAPFVAGTELVGGTLVLIGLFTRVATVPLMITMSVAILTAQRENVSSLGDLFGLIEWCYIALLAWIGIAGPGPLSVDALLVSRWATAREPPTNTLAPTATMASPALSLGITCRPATARNVSRRQRCAAVSDGRTMNAFCTAEPRARRLPKTTTHAQSARPSEASREGVEVNSSLSPSRGANDPRAEPRPSEASREGVEVNSSLSPSRGANDPARGARGRARASRGVRLRRALPDGARERSPR